MRYDSQSEKRMSDEVVVVGAGVAGLSCARELRLLGRPSVVLDKARGVGGRCATRRVDGRPVDHGVVFLHGSDAEFLALLRAVEGGGRLEGWPARVHGSGLPCQPGAFAPGESRLAYADGVSALPKHLAQDLDVRLGARVTSVEEAGGAMRVGLEGGEALGGRIVVLALPGEQAAALLAPLAARGARSAREVLAMTGTVPSLTVLAGYGADAPPPEWDVSYPGAPSFLQLISHDSTKRPGSAGPVLVYQCRPAWSRARIDVAADLWVASVLDEAARLLGEWARHPMWSQGQRWRHARAEAPSVLAGPLVAAMPGGAKLGLAGELFAPDGGVQGAWRSGRALARMLGAEEKR